MWRWENVLLVLLLGVRTGFSLPCPLDWEFAGNNCYLMNASSQLSWPGADSLCRENGASLVTVLSRSKHVDLYELLTGSLSFQWWINIKQTYGDSNTWNRQLPVDFFGEDKIIVDAGDGSKCVYLSSEDGLWYWGKCEQLKSFICEKPSNRDDIQTITTNRELPHPSWFENNAPGAYAQLYANVEEIIHQEEKSTSERPVTPSTTARSAVTTASSPHSVTTPAPNLCSDNSWMMVGPSCYKMFLYGKNWTTAESFCRMQGGNLASFVDRLAEETFLQRFTYHTGYVWNGLNKHEDGIWYWSTNASLNYLAWESGQPDGQNLSETCGSVGLHSKQWTDEDCSAYKPFICQRPRNATEQVTTTSPEVQTSTTPSPCGSGGWFQYSGSCYFAKIDGEAVSWHSAQKKCQQMSSNLAKISSYPMNTFMLGKISSSTLPVWIGLNRLRTSRALIWPDLSQPDFTMWGSYRSKRYDMKSCARIHQETGKWTLQNCNAPQFYLCEKPMSGRLLPAPSKKPTRNPKCRSGWTLYGNRKCLKISETKSVWRDARSECLKKGQDSDLLSISNAYDQAHLTLAIKNISESLWTGLNYIKSGVRFYSWSDESALNYTNWAPGQPSAVCDACPKTCGLISGGMTRMPGVWDDVDCNHEFHYICQMSSYSGGSEEPQKKMCSGVHSKFESIGNACYYVKDVQDTWADALSYCRAHSSSLAYVGNIFDNAELLLLLEGRTHKNFWLGLSEAGLYGEMQWTAPWPQRPEFTLWDEKGSRKAYKSSCASISATNATWSYNECNSTNAYVCMYAPDRAGKVDTKGCPSSDWSVSSNRCYLSKRDFQGTVTWNEAKSRCEAEGYQLAIVSTSEDQLALHDAVSRMAAEDEAWIGLRLSSENNFEWVDGTGTSFSSWQVGLPLSNGEACVVASKKRSGQWNQVACNSYRAYICMVEKLPTAQPNQQSPSKSDGWSVFGIICLVVVVLVSVVFLINMVVRHYFISWTELASVITSGKMIRPSSGRPTSHHSIENLAYNHQEEVLTENGTGANSNYEVDTREGWGSQQELVECK